MEQFIELLKSSAFQEKAVLLLLTAVLTGVVVPQIMASLSQSRFREQKIFEAEIQRQRDILSAQSELLKNLSRLVWDFQLMNINISFYKLNGSIDGYKLAIKNYQNRSAEVLGQIRAELSMARRLVSPAMHQKLSKLYFETLLPIDSNLELLIQGGSGASKSEWRRQHDNSFESAQKQIDEVMTELARELRLVAPVADSKGK